MAVTRAVVAPDMRQRCKACGRIDSFDFSVPTEVWASVVPEHLWSHVVCLGCFDRFAHVRDIDYAPHVRTLYFVGDHAVLTFELVSPMPNGLPVVAATGNYPGDTSPGTRCRTPP